MKETCWKDCLQSSAVSKISKDVKKAQSLEKTCEGRLKFMEGQLISQENANYVFEGIYTSAIELLHASSLREGYKIQNHLCLGFYLKEIKTNEELFRTFNDLRIKRNSLVYYGEEMDFEVAKDAIDKAKKLIRRLKELK